MTQMTEETVVETTTSAMTSVISGMSDVFDVAESCLDAVLGNEVLLFVFTACVIVPIAFGVLSQLKNVAR